MKSSATEIVADTLYNNNIANEANTYNPLISYESEEPIISSIVEQQFDLQSKLVWGSYPAKPVAQQQWEMQVAAAVAPVAEDDPFKPFPEPSVVSASEAMNWVPGSKGLETRPRLFDGVTKTHMLCDTGSMVSIFPRTEQDKLSKSCILRAVNGSSIKTFGKKEVTLRLGRKTYKLDVVIAEVDQPIIGWDFISRYKLDFEWGQFDDLYLVDKRANIKHTLSCVTIPFQSLPQTAALIDLSNSSGDRSFLDPQSVAFEVASMKLFGPEKEIEENLLDKQPQVIQEMFKKFPGILSQSFQNSSAKHGVIHSINTGSSPACTAKLRPIMPGTPKAIKGKQAWDKLIEMGVVERVKAGARTEWSSPLHMAPKGENRDEIRPCSDFRQLNARTVADVYPLPNLKSFTHKLHGSKVFSKVDLFAAFHNIPIDAKDVHKTATLTPWGVFVYKRLAFGLQNGPSSFQRLLDVILADIPGLFIYMDDLLVHSRTEAEHLQTLEKIFAKLHENGLAINLKKCEFLKKSVTYLGYKVTPTGILPLQRKVQAIVNFQPPQKQKELLHYLGALNYFRSSLKGVKRNGVKINPAQVLQPLYELATTKLPPKVKLSDIWDRYPAIIQSFQDSKQMLVNAVELTHPDPNAPLVLCTDSSDYAIGGSLEQLGPDGVFHPLAFYSKHLPPDKRKWSTFRKELFACQQSLRYFLPEFYGRHITVYSDHAPLIKSFESNTLQSHDPVAQRQLIEIGMFTKDIRHIVGRENTMADFLSRPPVDKIGDAYKIEEVSALEGLKIETLSGTLLSKAQANCPIVDLCKEGKHPPSLSFSVEEIDGVKLCCETSLGKPRPVIPKEYQEYLIKAYHDVDHPGNRESQRRLLNHYYWPDMRKQINKYVKECHPCQITKPSKNKKPHNGHFEVPRQRFSHIHVDIVGELPLSRGYKFLLTVACRTTRFVTAIPMTSATTEACADALLHGWVATYGVPAHCTSDNGVSFVSNLWKAMQAKLGVKLHFTSLYNPQANGLLERQHDTLKTSLKAAMIQMGDKYQDKWYDYLPWVLLNKRVSHQKELGASPSELVFGNNDVAIPGDLLQDPGEPLSKLDISKLVSKLQQKTNRNPAPTYTNPNQTQVPEPPASVTHVYTKNHKKTGLDPSYSGPFTILKRLSRSRILIKVGLNADGSDRQEERHWRDCKFAHLAPDAKEASRPKRGRPSTKAPNPDNLFRPEQVVNATPTPEPVTLTDANVQSEVTTNDAVKVNKPVRSTRNPTPLYAWSASQQDLNELNYKIKPRAA